MTNKNILIVDDEEQVSRSLGEIIKRTYVGVRIFSISSPQQALLCIKNTKIDIAIIDIRMPKISGLDILKSLKEQQSESRAFIITGYGDENTRREAFKLGAEEFICKPFNPDVLIDLIEKGA